MQEPTIQWRRRPEPGRDLRLWRLKRAPAKGMLIARVVSHDVLGCDTHYFAGRTRPCTGQLCKICDQGHRPREHYYYAAIEGGSGDRIIVEITLGVLPQFADYFNGHRTLKGAIAKLSRTSQKANGRLWASVEEPPKDYGQLPAEPDLRRILLTLWEVNDKAEPSKLIAPHIAEATHQKQDNRADEQNDLLAG